MLRIGNIIVRMEVLNIKGLNPMKVKNKKKMQNRGLQIEELCYN